MRAHYRIDIRPAARRALRRIAVSERERIGRAIDSLAADPRPPGVVKLAGEEAYRVRVGDYRIIYEIRDRELVVLVIAIGPREHVYRRRG
jgi:mRNA interferase RelE/StbE